MLTIDQAKALLMAWELRVSDLLEVRRHGSDNPNANSDIVAFRTIISVLLDLTSEEAQQVIVNEFIGMAKKFKDAPKQ